MGIKTSLLLGYKYRFYGYFIFIASLGLVFLELFLLKHKLSECYFLYPAVLGLFISAVSREKKETNRTIVMRYRALKMFFIITIPALVIMQAIEDIFKIKLAFNLLYICFSMTFIFNVIYFYYYLKNKKKEDDDV